MTWGLFIAFVSLSLSLHRVTYCFSLMIESFFFSLLLLSITFELQTIVSNGHLNKVDNHIFYNEFILCLLFLHLICKIMLFFITVGFINYLNING